MAAVIAVHGTIQVVINTLPADDPSIAELSELRAALLELIDAAHEFRQGVNCHIPPDCPYCRPKDTRLMQALTPFTNAQDDAG